MSQGYVWLLLLNIYYDYKIKYFGMERLLPEKLKYHIQNYQNIISDEFKMFIIETYNNYMMLHYGRIKRTEMFTETVFPFKYERNDTNNWKCVLLDCFQVLLYLFNS